MKRISYMLGILAAALSMGCEKRAEVLFTEPQPMEAKDLQTYPTALRGSYINDSTMRTLEIEATRVLTGYDHIKITEQELRDMGDSAAYELREGTIYIREDDKEYPYTRSGDTLLINADLPEETIYQLGPACLLRTAGNAYFLNSYNVIKGHWETVVVKVTPTALRIWYPKPADYTGVAPEQRSIVMLRDSLGKELSLDYYLLSMPKAQFLKRATAMQLRQPDAIFRRKSTAKSRR